MVSEVFAVGVESNDVYHSPRLFCLLNGRTPAHFLSRYWRTGNLGAFRMGLRLGAYCVGCCWILMGLLFVGGVMNFLWIAAIAIFVPLEKTLPFGDVTGRFAGTAMILAGALSLAILTARHSPRDFVIKPSAGRILGTSGREPTQCRELPRLLFGSSWPVRHRDHSWFVSSILTLGALPNDLRVRRHRALRGRRELRAIWEITRPLLPGAYPPCFEPK